MCQKLHTMVSNRDPAVYLRTATHLTVVIQLGQRDIHGLVLFFQLIIASLPTIQLQLRVVQGSFQLFSVCM